MYDELVKQVRSAAQREEVRVAVRDIYDRLQRRVDERNPVCASSGKCCHFDEYGHRLYVTTAELAVFVNDLPKTASESKAEKSEASLLPIFQSDHPGGCIFQNGKLCGVHKIRPFGCRIFYCDPTAERWQQDQYEQFHGELKALHDRLGIAYFYVEWRVALAALSLTKF